MSRFVAVQDECVNMDLVRLVRHGGNHGKWYIQVWWDGAPGIVEDAFNTYYTFYFKYKVEMEQVLEKMTHD